MTMENVTPITAIGSDPLLDALVTLTRIHHKPFSAESLAAGLPLEQGLFTPALFVRAAQRAGFSAKHLERSLGDIPNEVLPVALVLNDHRTCIVTALTDDDATVILPADDDAAQDIPRERLNQLYAGKCFYLKPDYDYATASSQDPERHWFWSTIRRSRGLYGEVLIASLLINMFALVSPLFIMNVYDRVVPNYATDTLWVLVSGVLIVFVFDLAMKSLRGYFIDVAGKRADILLSSRTFARVMDIRMSERPARVGSFANNLQEFDAFRDFFTSTTLTALIDLPFVILFIALIFSIGGILAAIPLTAIPFVLFTSFIFQKPLQRTITKTFAESSRKHAMLIETLTGLDAIKAARAEGVMQKKWEETNARLARLGLRSRLLSLSTVNFAQTIQQVATVTMVVCGVYRIMEADLSVGGLIACTILTGRCLAPMAQVASILSRYHHSMAAYGAIDRVMNLPTERPEGHKFLHRSELDGAIEFRNVSFTYPNSQVAALREINLSIAPGEKIGIIGRMGSGKSTLQKLLMNFYQPDDGSMLVSGTDINQLDPTDLRRNMTHVPQDVMLFDGTIRENIVIGAPLADDAAVLHAAELAGLSSFVDQHPQGFDLMIGERGTNLSGGQRQAVAIARAFITDAPILLLDEPTNSMDNTTENIFKTKLQAYMADKTLLLVTHKTSLLSLVDRLIVMNEGRVVADGPKDEVLRTLSGS
ncbi:MAG TPA: type I secretion system permease/ATPase [Pseudomonadales bacterium]|nr:type I secretion system permease/ATPase [Pseudomonadales bacterium]